MATDALSMGQPYGLETTENDWEIDKIKGDITQEQQMKYITPHIKSIVEQNHRSDYKAALQIRKKELLEKSTYEMKQTIDQLEKRIDGIDLEGNEWKTRYETQQEINFQFEKQVISLQQKVEATKQKLSGLKKPASHELEESVEPTPFKVQSLQKQHESLENQVRDLEWRLEQESKAYHKANDERKQYIVEINTANFALDNMMVKLQQGHHAPQTTSLRNIPEDQRVIDPKRGPIRKTAAVKALPKLENGSFNTARF